MLTTPFTINVQYPKSQNVHIFVENQSRLKLYLTDKYRWLEVITVLSFLTFFFNPICWQLEQKIHSQVYIPPIKIDSFISRYFHFVNFKVPELPPSRVAVKFKSVVWAKGAVFIILAQTSSQRWSYIIVQCYFGRLENTYTDFMYLQIIWRQNRLILCTTLIYLTTTKLGGLRLLVISIRE